MELLTATVAAAPPMSLKSQHLLRRGTSSDGECECGGMVAADSAAAPAVNLPISEHFSECSFDRVVIVFGSVSNKCSDVYNVFKA